MGRRDRFAAASPQRDNVRRSSRLEPYLRQRRAAGCRNGLQLWRAIRERGDTGGSRAVSRWAQERRVEPAPATPCRYLPVADGMAPARPPARRLAVPQLAWLLDRLRAACRDSLPTAASDRAHRPGIGRAAARRRVGRSLGLRRARRRDLRCWPTARAVRVAGGADAAIEHRPVEGHITRLRLVKRQGYGRCGLEILKCRLLWAA